MRKTRILVTGLNGFIGSRFADLTKNSFALAAFPHTNKGSVSQRKYVFDFISRSDADLVLHLAARTHIDRCQVDRRLGKKSQTWKVNTIGSKNIADACAEFNKHLIYLSTECIFDGKKKWYRESDCPNPLNWYGTTKLKGEEAVVKSGSKYCILRSTLAYGHPQRFPYDLFYIFLNKLKNNQKINAVSDQFLSLTFIDDLINTIAVVAKNRATGIFHYAGNRSISPFAFAKKIAGSLKKQILVNPVSLRDYFGERSRFRLKYALLSSDKIKREYHISASDLDNNLKILLSKI